MKDRIFTKEEIIAQLEGLNIPVGVPVLMHSSLRLIGSVEGGATVLLDALIERFTRGGGLFCVPTHTWSNLECDIVLDMNDEKTCLGAFSEIALRDGRGVRSENPTHSMVVFGERERVLDFVRDDERTISGTDPDGCYGKIYREGGYILLVGVAHNRNTYLHCVEEIIGMPDRVSDTLRTVKVRRASGEIVERQTKTHKVSFTNDVSLRYPKYETAFRYHGGISDGFIGSAPTQVCSARIMKDVMELIFKRSEGVDPLINEWQLSPKLYY